MFSCIHFSLQIMMTANQLLVRTTECVLTKSTVSYVNVLLDGLATLVKTVSQILSVQGIENIWKFFIFLASLSRPLTRAACCFSIVFWAFLSEISGFRSSKWGLILPFIFYYIFVFQILMSAHQNHVRIKAYVKIMLMAILAHAQRATREPTVKQVSNR